MYELKECNHCKKWKFKTDFHKSSKAKDGYKSDCKKCRRKINNEIADSIRNQNTDAYIKRVGLTVYKTCSCCKENKLCKHFKIRRDLKSGYSGMCKKCHNKKTSIYYYKNSDKILLKDKERRDKPENKKIKAIKSKAYRQANHQKEILRQLKYRCFKMANQVLDDVKQLSDHTIKLRSIRLDKGLKLFPENSVEYIVIRKAQGILFQEACNRNINIRLDLI